jgi:hypothetical protein
MIKYERNLGGLDRFIRMILGAVLVYISVFRYNWIGDPILIGLTLFFGGMNIISSIVCWCPPYSLIGFSTHRKPRPSLQEPP